MRDVTRRLHRLERRYALQADAGPQGRGLASLLPALNASPSRAMPVPLDHRPLSGLAGLLASVNREEAEGEQAGHLRLVQNDRQRRGNGGADE